MKYRENMTPEELSQFKREIDALEKAYQDAARLDSELPPCPEDWEDEMEYWRSAGLDSRGRP